MNELQKVLIIAEAGVNHNGDLDMAKGLVDAAAQAGADIVKFQSFKTENLVTHSASKARYQEENTEASESQYRMLKRLELSETDHMEIISHCRKKNIRFLSTAFDLESINFIENLVDLYKIPSGEITNLPYLELISEKGKDVILSTGMSNLEEIEEAIKILTNGNVGKEQITLLHCNTQYPTPFEDVNLKAMVTMRDHFGVRVGYSDHTLGVEVPIAAVALGASVIEKHFTLDRNLPGPDHNASLTYEELAKMVKGIRNIEKAISGSGKKEPSPSEIENIEIARKSLVYKQSLSKGTIIERDYLDTKRPGSGISPMKINEVVGKRLNKNVNKDDLITYPDFE